MADLLNTIHTEIDARLDELRPSLAEYEQLMVAAGALVENGGGPAPTPPRPRVTRTVRTANAPVAKPDSRAGVIEQTTRDSTPKRGKSKVSPRGDKAVRAQRGAAREAILAALDHGSHTVSELVVVTAMSAANLNGNLRRLVSTDAVIKVEREGKTAYALA